MKSSLGIAGDLVAAHAWGMEAECREHNGIQAHTYKADNGMVPVSLLSNRFKQQLGACDKLPLWHEWGKPPTHYEDVDRWQLHNRVMADQA